MLEELGHDIPQGVVDRTVVVHNFHRMLPALGLCKLEVKLLEGDACRRLSFAVRQVTGKQERHRRPKAAPLSLFDFQRRAKVVSVRPRCEAVDPRGPPITIKNNPSALRQLRPDSFQSLDVGRHMEELHAERWSFGKAHVVVKCVNLSAQRAGLGSWKSQPYTLLPASVDFFG